MLLLLPLLTILASCDAAPPAASPQCSLLGHLVGGRCLCDKGWTGATCSVADLKPLDLKLGYDNLSSATWGGRPVEDPKTGMWSLIVSQFSNKCPLAMWTNNSQVVRAVSSTGPAGPYEFAELVYSEFHHNPSVVGPTPDGYYLIFMIGSHQPHVADCTNGVDPEWVGSGDWLMAGHIAMGYSRTPEGPWSTPRIILQNNHDTTKNQSDWDYYVTNPSASLLPNGTVMLVFSSVPGAGGFSEALGVAFAPHWNGTYVEDKTPVWLKPGPRFVPTPTQGVGNIEDPFTWVDQRGNHHIIAHSQGTVNLCQATNNGWKPGNSAGVHLFASSPRGPWTASQEAVYCGDMMLTNGTRAHMMTRQRPQLVFDADGFTPKVLFMGGSFDEYNQGITSLERTFAFEF